MSLSAADKKAYQEYLEVRTKIVSNKTSEVPVNEPAKVREKRLERLKGDFEQF